MAHILTVDDDDIFCETFTLLIEEMGHSNTVAESIAEGHRRAYEEAFDIIFLDVILPDGSGLERIGDFKNVPSSPEVIIITGRGEESGIETALKNGALDYLIKPPSASELKRLVGRALRYREEKSQFLRRHLLKRDFIIGKDPKIQKCLELVSRAAASDGSVLITGETGTGKELMARAIHVNSRRAAAPFVTVDCTNLPENLIETLLFGHMKGTFTGADQNRDGLIKQADGGVLFLDEVGDLPLAGQKAMLRVLQNRTFRPLGAKREEKCDFRVISATNKNIEKMVEEGSFRKDLYFRLMAFHIELPPLRERPGDIRLLANNYIVKICDELGIDTIGVSKDFIESLKGWRWTGNVRELINVLRVSIANGMESSVLQPHHLPMEGQYGGKACSRRQKGIPLFQRIPKYK
ncbi:MAG: sigma-54-dependent Fis family transcriptional regulator [Deltaproteobacteria bacterium]|nr:sigma-54-dependent Fis family transcriptional regulator [Deltaproteobacteria bacterium]